MSRLLSAIALSVLFCNPALTFADTGLLRTVHLPAGSGFEMA
jgi:hypothetical protein